jgi:hypothetical protein
MGSIPSFSSSSSTPPATEQEVRAKYFLRYEIIDGQKTLVKKEIAKRGVWEWLSLFVFRHLRLGSCYISDFHHRDVLKKPMLWLKLPDFASSTARKSSSVAAPVFGREQSPVASFQITETPGAIDSFVSRRGQPQDRIGVFRSTIQICQNRQYCVNGITVSWSEQDVQRMQERTEVIPSSQPIVQKREGGQTTITVVNGDSFDVAKSLIDKGLHPIVLNMANSYTPGGGVEGGASAQEECLYRCSNLFQSLGRQSDHINPHLNQRLEQLGLPGQYRVPEDGVIVSKQVKVFRDSEDQGFGLKKQPFHVDVVSAAAYCLISGACDAPLLPGYQIDAHGMMLNPEGRVVLPHDAIDMPAMRLHTERKLRSILRAAHANGNDALVLGAIGCGAFDDDRHTNRTLVIELLTQILREEEFKGAFTHITFAVLDKTPEKSLYHDFDRAFNGFIQ